MNNRNNDNENYNKEEENIKNIYIYMVIMGKWEFPSVQWLEDVKIKIKTVIFEW